MCKRIASRICFFPLVPDMHQIWSNSRACPVFWYQSNRDQPSQHDKSRHDIIDIEVRTIGCINYLIKTIDYIANSSRFYLTSRLSLQVILRGQMSFTKKKIVSWSYLKIGSRNSSSDTQNANRLAKEVINSKLTSMYQHITNIFFSTYIYLFGFV